MGILTATTAVIVVLSLGLVVTDFGGADAEIAKYNPHQKVECLLCHKTTASSESSNLGLVDPTLRCRDCHSNDPNGRFGRTGFHLDLLRKCTDCHSFHHPTYVNAKGRQFNADLTASSTRAFCGSCHSESPSMANLSKGHVEAANAIHSDYVSSLPPSQACLGCHSENGISSPDLTLTAKLTPQFDDRHDHPLGVLVVPGSGVADMGIRPKIDARLPLFDGRIECQTCHSLTLVTKDRLNIENSTELCRGCHIEMSVGGE